MFRSQSVRGGGLGDEVTSQTQAIQSIADKIKHAFQKNVAKVPINRFKHRLNRHS